MSENTGTGSTGNERRGRPGRPSTKENPDFIRMELRLDPELRNRLRALADADERSLHGYIVRVLRDHVSRAGEPR